MYIIANVNLNPKEGFDISPIISATIRIIPGIIVATKTEQMQPHPILSDSSSSLVGL